MPGRGSSHPLIVCGDTRKRKDVKLVQWSQRLLMLLLQPNVLTANAEWRHTAATTRCRCASRRQEAGK